MLLCCREVVEKDFYEKKNEKMKVELLATQAKQSLRTTLRNLAENSIRIEMLSSFFAMEVIILCFQLNLLNIAQYVICALS